MNLRLKVSDLGGLTLAPLGDSLANPITILLLLSDISQVHINSSFSDKHAKGLFLHSV